MGKLTTTVFNESCCDGGACNNDQSCQPCGCDPGANWVCAMHKTEHRYKTALMQIRDSTEELFGCFTAWSIADAALSGQ